MVKSVVKGAGQVRGIKYTVPGIPRIVVIAKKRLLPSIAALRHMMRQPRNHHSRESCHCSVNFSPRHERLGKTLTPSGVLRLGIRYTVPVIPRRGNSRRHSGLYHRRLAKIQAIAQKGRDRLRLLQTLKPGLLCRFSSHRPTARPLAPSLLTGETRPAPDGSTRCPRTRSHPCVCP